jgi:hypothetical protein
MVGVTERKQRLHKQKVLKRLKFYVSLFLGLCLTGGLIWVVFFSPVFEIKTIIISGADQADILAIEELVNQSLTANSWGFTPIFVRQQLASISFNTKSFLWKNTSSLENNLEKTFPQYSESQIKFSLWQRELNVSVSKRMVAAVWCNQNICGLIDTKGIYFEQLASVDPVSIIKETQYSNYPFLKGLLSGGTDTIGSLIVPPMIITKMGEWYNSVKESPVAFREILLNESTASCFKARTIVSNIELTFNPESDIAKIVLAIKALQEKIKNNPSWQGLQSLNLCFYPKIYYTPESFFTR